MKSKSLIWIMAGVLLLCLCIAVVPVSAAVTIVAAGDQIYYFGETIKFSGTNDEGAVTYLLITGPNVAAQGADFQNFTVIEGIGDSFTNTAVTGGTWKLDWSISETNPVFDAGTYTIFAESQPHDKYNLTSYGTVSIILKRPFISTTVHPGHGPAGTVFHFTGTREGTPLEYANFLVTNFSFGGQTSLPENGVNPEDFSVESITGNASTFGRVQVATDASFHYDWDTSTIAHGSVRPGTYHILAEMYPRNLNDALAEGGYTKLQVVIDGPGQPIEQGATLFIGEQDLDVTHALNKAQGVASPYEGVPVEKTIGWWAPAADPYTTTPTVNNDTSEQYTNLLVDQTVFDGYFGNWYVVDHNTGFAINPSSPVFIVEEQSLGMKIVYSNHQSLDAVPAEVPQGTPITFRLTTNMYKAVDPAYRTTIDPNADGYINIRVKEVATGRVFDSLYNGTPGQPDAGPNSLLANFVDHVGGWYWGVTGPYYWQTGAKSSNQYLYPAGQYEVIAESTLHGMKMNYRNAGEDYVGRTVSDKKMINITVVDFAYDATHGLDVTFTDLSTGTPYSWDWDFGDGSAHSNLQNPPTHTYAAGTYPVTLTTAYYGFLHPSGSVTKQVTVVGITKDAARDTYTPPLTYPEEETKYASLNPIPAQALTFGGGQPPKSTPSGGYLVASYANRRNGDGPTNLYLVKTDGTREDLGVVQSLPNNVAIEAEDPYAETNGVTSFSTNPGKIGMGAIEMIPKCSAATCQNNYALLIDGGKSASDNHIRYWNDISFMYQTLTKVYHYPKANIIVLMSDGTSSGADRHYSTVNGVNLTDDSPRDLDSDNADETTVFTASRQNLQDKLSSLGSGKTTADTLFIFTTGHGGNDTAFAPNTNHSIYYLWDGAYISDTDFVSYLPSTFGSITMTMEQCYGGGFIDNFVVAGSQNRYIATAAADEPSYGNSYSNVWTRGVAMITDRGVPSTEADGDGNGKIAMKEACEFARATDPSATSNLTNHEHPQCNSTFADSGATKYLINSNDFTSANSVVVTAPNIAETWYAGFSRDITWARKGVANVKIELYNGSGTGNYYTLIAQTGASTGKWSWAIPLGSVPGTQGTLYKIRINDSTTSATTDMSNQYFTIKASGAMGSLKVNSTPAGATIWLDGVSKGTTTTAGTAVANVPPGSHTVTITGPTGDPGYLDQSKGITLGSGSTNYPVSFTLLPIDKNSLDDTGRMVITSSQGEAEVWVDGQLAGTTPFEREVLPGTDWKNGNYPRKYTVMVKKPGYKPSDPQDVEVGRGWTANQDFPLEQDSGWYKFTGFKAPIDMGGVYNKANAGRTIPVKWHLTGSNGDIISDPRSILGLKSDPVVCNSGASMDELEEYVPISNSGLQYQGNGDWHYNWVTSKAFTQNGGCRNMYIEFENGDISTIAYFKFK